ncbi:hypothetical protein B0T11DRAFT_116848 [Plectosphaerella cucumerina]|uniref:PAS domain-containing protein n=1 Tax=Plectosphaerella cucumerina TaxID=40658 RepID=A0A8K0TD87_9PEZI|nr:hypothetical protein B0T11DRAFT_116848 [Plectosphaerella cucumerina]
MPRQSDPLTPPPSGAQRAGLYHKHAPGLAIDTVAANFSRIRPAAVSPPVTPYSARHDKLSSRLRSNSGLSLHTNEDALRRYTDYNSDGSPRTPTFDSSVTWGSIDGVASGSRQTPRRTMPPPTPHQPEQAALPIPDFFSQKVFQAVLANPSTRDRFVRFARRSGAAADIDFLLGIATYARSLAQFVDQLSSVPRPVDLPFSVSRSLNVDLKHLSNSVLPGLDSVFSESKQFVEQRVRDDVFPSFVAQQLSLRAAAALTDDRTSRASDLRGLGTAFCLADAEVADNPIISVSDGFLSLTGYTKEEVLLRSCSFLQGARTDQQTAARISEAVSQGKESTEVILNYRRDSWPFWNMLCLFPITDTNGIVRRYLGAQINVSETLANTDDILRSLSYGPLEPEGSDAEADGDDSPVGRRPSTRDCGPDRKGSSRPRSGSTRGFFKQFKKSSSSSSSHSHTPSGSISLPSASSISVDSRPDTLTHYSRFLLLRQSDPSPASNRVSRVPSLRVAYASPAALEALDITASPAAFQHDDVFSFLSDEAGSPSVTKSFRSTVQQRVLREGHCERLNVVLGGGKQHRRGTSMSISLTSRSTSDIRDGLEARDKDRRPSRPVSRSGFASFVGGETSKAEVLASHWAPLKDAAGLVEYVVVILTPA